MKAYDLFAQVEIPNGVDPKEILRVMEAAAIKEAWGFVGVIQKEDEELKQTLGLSDFDEDEDIRI